MNGIKCFTKSEHYKSVLLMMVFSIMAVTYVVLLSTSTSPLYDISGWGDSVIFQTVGKYWAEGVLPYSGLFDHKGPAIFWIDMFGYSLAGNRYGILLCQFIGLIVTEIFTYKLLRRALNRKNALFITGLTLVALMYNYDGGNMTEEYALPFVTVSIYYLFSWTEDANNKKKYEHNWKYAFIYGLTFSFCIMTRVTNAVGVCAGVLVITIVLIIHGKWKNLFLNVCSFLLGTAALIIPFCIYFGSKGHLYDMWFGTLFYNLSYTKHALGNTQILSLRELILYLMSVFNSFCLIGVEVYILLRKRIGINHVLWLVVSGITSLMLVMGNSFGHYGMIALPYFPIALIEMIKMACCDKSEAKKRWKLVDNILMVGIVFVTIAGSALSIRSMILSQLWTGGNKTFYDISIMDEVPENEKNSFVAWECPSGLYLKENIRPYYPYFILQDWQGRQNEILEKIIYDTFDNGDVEWILCRDGSQNGIQDILNRDYIMVSEEKVSDVEIYVLYQRK